MDTLKLNKGETLMVAHRGLSGIEKENTLPAFVAAGNRSFYGIETDVHRTADGQFVVIHDDSTKRVAGVDFVIEETDFDTLRSIQLIDRDGTENRIDLKIPTLREYIRTCKRYEKKSVLELKNEFSFEDVERVVDIIKKEGYIENVIFISFCFENLVRIRKILPGHEVQFLFEEYTEETIERVKEHGFGIDILYTSLNKERIEECHSKGIKVNCWICDDLKAAEDFVEWGIDFITTDIIE